MQKSIEIARIISKDLDKNWTDILEQNNIHSVFGAIYSIKDVAIEDQNRIISFIIYAYSPDSLWLDLKKDRIDNKKRILESLGANLTSAIFKKVLYNSEDIVGMCIFNFMEELKTWKWPIIFTLLDYSAKMQRFSGEQTEPEKKWDELDKAGGKHTLTEQLDIADILKANKEKGSLLQLAIEKRIQADSMIAEIEKDFLSTDIASQEDFGFKFTETAKKRDVMSWREFIRDKKDKEKQKSLSGIS